MKRFDLSVGQRLAAGSLIVAVLIAVLSAVLFLSVARVSALRREKLEVIAPRARLAQDLERAIYQQAVAFRNYALTGSPADREEFRRARRDVERQIELVDELPKEPGERALFEQIVAIVDEHQRGFDEMLTLARAGAERDAIREAEVHVSAHRIELLGRVRRFTELQVAKGEVADAAINLAVDELRITVIVVALLILGASLLSASIIARSVREPADRLVTAAEAMRGGTFEPAVALAEPTRESGRGEPRERFRDELREASHVFGVMATALKRRENRLAAHARLSATLGASLDVHAVAADSLREITSHVGAEVGAVYLLDPESNALRVVAAHALDAALPDVASGAGIPGHAAADRRTLVIRDIPPDTPFRIELGLALAPPRFLVASPMIVEDRVIGVVLLGALRELEAEGVRFVEDAACQLAITLDNALAHTQVAHLVAQLRQTNERLAEQNEELQAQSEELQTQSEELQAQNEELQAQSDELRAQQDSLASTNRALAEAEEQKNRFLAVLGHELRNPLAAIRGAVALADDGGVSTERANEVIEVMKRQTAHL
ncbi:MAG TPA: GAF domain-containing protein, partial [Thermoanaerobaculia bacterium]|nr:GAF domain-containing protein [Thermoanaerobaculia bacterium]